MMWVLPLPYNCCMTGVAVGQTQQHTLTQQLCLKTRHILLYQRASVRGEALQFENFSAVSGVLRLQSC